MSKESQGFRWLEDEATGKPIGLRDPKTGREWGVPIVVDGILYTPEGPVAVGEGGGVSGEALDAKFDKAGGEVQGPTSFAAPVTFMEGVTVQAPTFSGHPVTLGYMSAQLAGDSKTQVVKTVVTTNVTPASATVAGQSHNGYTLVSGDDVLLTGQTTRSQNGIYRNGARSPLLDEWSEAVRLKGIVSAGTLSGSEWSSDANAGGTLGTTDLVFVESGAGKVSIVGAQTIAGAKTFSLSPIVPTPAPGTATTAAASTAFVANAITDRAIVITGAPDNGDGRPDGTTVVRSDVDGSGWLYRKVAGAYQRIDVPSYTWAGRPTANAARLGLRILITDWDEEFICRLIAGVYAWVPIGKKLRLPNFNAASSAATSGTFAARRTITAPAGLVLANCTVTATAHINYGGTAGTKTPLVRVGGVEIGAGTALIAATRSTELAKRLFVRDQNGTTVAWDSATATLVFPTVNWTAAVAIDFGSKGGGDVEVVHCAEVVIDYP